MPNDETYTKGELDQKFRSFEEKNDAWSADIMRAIEKSHAEQMERHDLTDAKIDPLIEIYDGAMFARKFIIGLSTIVLSIAAVGGGMYWVVNWIRHG